MADANVDIVIDCADPEALAEFWAAALGYDKLGMFEASQFEVENLLREARRQRRLPDARVPAVCLLDPDGDVVRHLRATRGATRDPAWACYHSELWVTERPYGPVGIVPCAVGAPYAV